MFVDNDCKKRIRVRSRDNVGHCDSHGGTLTDFPTRENLRGVPLADSPALVYL